MTNLEKDIKNLNSELNECETLIKYSTEYAREKGYVDKYIQRAGRIRAKLQLLEEAQKLVDMAADIEV